MSSISYQQVSKSFADGTEAVRNVTLDITDGEFVVFVGPSGCGKSTLLRMLAGLETVSEGEITLDAQAVTHLQPKRRDIAMVFQNYALYPHMSVRDNIGFALKQRGLSKAEVRAAVDGAAESLELTELLDRKPRQLSGGQRQRVAVGRAIVREPKALLLDEPLSNLDAKLRGQMRGELGRLHRSLGTTTLFVTHDQVEAMTLGQRVAVFAAGQLLQFAEPRALYHEPINTFVAGFIGNPGMNFAEARVREGEGKVLEFGSQSQMSVQGTALEGPLSRDGAREVIVGFRPESARLTNAPVEGGLCLGAEVAFVEHVEPEVFVDLIVTEADVRIRKSTDFDGSGESDGALGGRRLITVRTNPAEAPSVGEHVHAVVGAEDLHLFDRGSTLAIR